MAEGTLEIKFEGFRNDKGHMLAALYGSEQGFPDDPDAALRAARLEIIDGAASCVWQDVPYGEYAVVAMHDENDNEELDTNILGLPKEGFAFSGDKLSMGRPKFEKMKFTHDAEHSVQEIKVHYLL